MFALLRVKLGKVWSQTGDYLKSCKANEQRSRFHSFWKHLNSQPVSSQCLQLQLITASSQVDVQTTEVLISILGCCLRQKKNSWLSGESTPSVWRLSDRIQERPASSKCLSAASSSTITPQTTMEAIAGNSKSTYLHKLEWKPVCLFLSLLHAGLVLSSTAKPVNLNYVQLKDFLTWIHAVVNSRSVVLLSGRD